LRTLAVGNDDASVGNYKINRLLSADDLELLASSEQGLRRALGRLVAVCNQTGMKTTTDKGQVLCLSGNPRQCTLQLHWSRSSSTLGWWVIPS